MTKSANLSAMLILNQRRYAEELLGEETVAQALASMPDEARRRFEALVPVAWCPIETAYEFHVAMARATGENVDAWHRRVVRHGMERTFTTVWRMFLRLTTLEALVKRAAAVYSKSYDRGEMSAHLSEGDGVEAVLTKWPGVPDFELDAIAIGIETVLHLSGRKQARVTFARTPDGARFQVRRRRAPEGSPV